MVIRGVAWATQGFHSNTEGNGHGIAAAQPGQGLAMTAGTRVASGGSNQSAVEEPCLRTFQERLLWAMEHILPKDRTRPFREPEVIALIQAGLNFQGQAVNPPELRQAYRMSSTDLVRGRKDRPSGEKLAVISGFFNTTVSFFAPYGSPDFDLDFVVRYARQVQCVRDAALNPMYLLTQRADGLTPASLSALSKYADFLHATQGDSGSRR
jgi:hypothetical protein